MNELALFHSESDRDNVHYIALWPMGRPLSRDVLFCYHLEVPVISPTAAAGGT